MILQAQAMADNKKAKHFGAQTDEIAPSGIGSGELIDKSGTQSGPDND